MVTERRKDKEGQSQKVDSKMFKVPKPTDVSQNKTAKSIEVIRAK